jgi:chaperonin cofactor prefoldin
MSTEDFPYLARLEESIEDLTERVEDLSIRVSALEETIEGTAGEE